MSYAIKKSGIYGDYDLTDDFNLIIYAESLPQFHDKIQDLDDFKSRQAQYFTPSNLKEGLRRSRDNIADVQGVLFDLDQVQDRDELKNNFYILMTKTKLEMYMWLTPSAIASGGHENGHRLFIPLDTPIDPRLLPNAVDELTIAFAKAGFNLLNYGVDLSASKTVSRLMGLPLQKSGMVVPWDLPERFRYTVKEELKESGFVPIFVDDGFSGLNEPTVENLTSFISGYMEKHTITFNQGERDNNLTRLIGAVAKAFTGISDDDLLEALGNVGDKLLLEGVNSWINRKDAEIISTKDTVQFNGVFVLDSWQYEFGNVYVRNNDMSIQPADYNNDIPASAVTLTDKYGVRLSNQNGLGNNGKIEYFTLDGHYKVLERSGNAVKVQIDQEPVWLQASFAE